MRESNPTSSNPGPLRLRAAKSQSVKYTTELSTSKNRHCSQGNACRPKSTIRKAANSFVAAKDCQPTRPYVDPYGSSSSESDSITGDRAPGLSTAPTNVVRRSRYETSMRKKVVLNKHGEETVKRKEIVKTLGMEVSESQERVRASGLNLRGGDRKLGIQDDKLCDETTSSLEDDSACSSGKLSEKKTGWTWTCSTCTETESQQRDASPPERPAKKSCGGRTSSQQASREVPSAWNSIERITSYHTNGRLGESNESQIVYQAGSGMKAEDKDVEGSHRYVLQDRYKDEMQRKDTSKLCGQESERQAHAKSVLEISTKIIGPEQFHAEIAWIASAGSKRGSQRVSEQNDKNDKSIKLKIEKLYDEVPHGSNGIKTKEHGSHNSLREAVEAVWKTSLGSKGGTENQDVEKDFLEKQYWDLHNEENLNVPLLSEECPCEKLEKISAQVDADDKISAYKKAWKATLGTKNTSEDNYLEKEPADPVFWCMQRDHENLEALVAREEGLQKEQIDPTTTQVPIEGRARGATVQKIPLHEASVEAADGIRLQVHERPEFNSKFKEELEQGARTLSSQELLQFKNPKLEPEEAEISDARKSFQEALAKERRANDGPQQESRISHMPVHSGSGSGSGPGKAQLKLMAESESRIAAEAKAKYFEACAKAAEKRLHSLLDERNWYYKKFVEEVEYNSDMKRLQHLMELEKASQKRQGEPQRKKVDVRLLVASSVVDDVLDEEDEDGQGAPQSGVDGPGSRQSDQEDLLQVDTCEDCDSLEFENWKREIENTLSERKYLAHGLRGKTKNESSDVKKDEEIVGGVYIPAEDNCTPAVSIPRHEGRDTRQKHITKKNIGRKNETKRPLSPINSSRKPPTLIEFGTIDLCCLKDRSPIERNKSTESPQESELVPKASSDREENTSFVRKLSDNPLYNCAESPVAASCELPLPTKWKKETKAELRRVMQEQELTWKIAENALEELARRLEVLENYKTNLQDTVRRSRAIGHVDGLLSQLEKNLEDFPGGFNILYSSPIFEQEVEKGVEKNPAQERCLSPNLSQISKDYEIQLLKAEIAHLRNEISRGERDRSPEMKAFVTDRDLSRLENVSEGHHSVPEVIATEAGPELPDDPFEEEKRFAKNEEPRCTGEIDRHAQYDEFAPIRRVHGFNGSTWSQTPNEENGAEIAIMVENGTNSGPGRPDYPQSCDQECNDVEAGNKNSDEGHFQAENAFKKLSEFFSEQETNFENLNEASLVPSEVTEPRAYYLDLLKRLSQQLAGLCHDLCEDNPSQQVDPVGIIPASIEKSHQVELVDKKDSLNITKAVDVEVEPGTTREKLKPNGIMTDNNSCTVKQSHEMIEVPTRRFAAESAKLRVALQVAERKFEKELKTNSLLKEKLDCQVKQISEVKAKNAEELEKKDRKITHENQMNKQLAQDMTQTETTLADFRSQNKELVASLDSRLQAARSEVTSLRDKVQALKIDFEQKENLASSLKGERNKTQQKIQDLRSQMQAFQFETDAMVGEKLELEKSIKQTRIEADEQRNRIKEFISINEDLIAVAQSKENEIKTLTKMVTSLQQSISEKSDAALRLLGETARLPQDAIKAREEGETYRNHHEILRSKLKETEQELMSREEAVERLTVHLGKTIEGQHFICEEKEQLLLSLNQAQSKERKLENEVQQLKIVIQDLEDKINCLDAEMTRMKTEIEDIKTRRQNALRIERQAQELKIRVHQLEEEIMEKEGQISILTSSFP